MEEIYKNYSRLVYNYLFRLTNNIELSEELTQETFYSAIKGINNFRGESSINVWLCQIAKNKWIDYLSKNKKINIIPIDENIEKVISNNYIEEEILTKEERISLYKKIHTLDINTREVIYLKLKDFTFKDIGNILEKSEEWARVTFYRAKVKLKEEFYYE